MTLSKTTLFANKMQNNPGRLLLLFIGIFNKNTTYGMEILQKKEPFFNNHYNIKKKTVEDSVLNLESSCAHEETHAETVDISIDFDYQQYFRKSQLISSEQIKELSEAELTQYNMIHGQNIYSENNKILAMTGSILNKIKGLEEKDINEETNDEIENEINEFKTQFETQFTWNFNNTSKMFFPSESVKMFQLIFDEIKNTTVKLEEAKSTLDRDKEEKKNITEDLKELEGLNIYINLPLRDLNEFNGADDLVKRLESKKFSISKTIGTKIAEVISSSQKDNEISQTKELKHYYDNLVEEKEKKLNSINKKITVGQNKINKLQSLVAELEKTKEENSINIKKIEDFLKITKEVKKYEIEINDSINSMLLENIKDMLPINISQYIEGYKEGYKSINKIIKAYEEKNIDLIIATQNLILKIFIENKEAALASALERLKKKSININKEFDTLLSDTFDLRTSQRSKQIDNILKQEFFKRKRKLYQQKKEKDIKPENIRWLKNIVEDLIKDSKSKEDIKKELRHLQNLSRCLKSIFSSQDIRKSLDIDIAKDLKNFEKDLENFEKNLRTVERTGHNNGDVENISREVDNTISGLIKNVQNTVGKKKTSLVNERNFYTLVEDIGEKIKLKIATKIEENNTEGINLVLKCLVEKCEAVSEKVAENIKNINIDSNKLGYTLNRLKQAQTQQDYINRIKLLREKQFELKNHLELFDKKKQIHLALGLTYNGRDISKVRDEIVGEIKKKMFEVEFSLRKLMNKHYGLLNPIKKNEIQTKLKKTFEEISKSCKDAILTNNENSKNYSTQTKYIQDLEKSSGFNYENRKKLLEDWMGEKTEKKKIREKTLNEFKEYCLSTVLPSAAETATEVPVVEPVAETATEVPVVEPVAETATEVPVVEPVAETATEVPVVAAETATDAPIKKVAATEKTALAIYEPGNFEDWFSTNLELLFEEDNSLEDLFFLENEINEYYNMSNYKEDTSLKNTNSKKNTLIDLKEKDMEISLEPQNYTKTTIELQKVNTELQVVLEDFEKNCQKSIEENKIELENLQMEVEGLPLRRTSKNYKYTIKPLVYKKEVVNNSISEKISESASGDTSTEVKLSGSNKTIAAAGILSILIITIGGSIISSKS